MNRELEGNNGVFVVDKFERMPKSQAKALLDFMIKTLPTSQLSPQTVKFMLGAKRTEVSVAYGPDGTLKYQVQEGDHGSSFPIPPLPALPAPARVLAPGWAMKSAASVTSAASPRKTGFGSLEREEAAGARWDGWGDTEAVTPPGELAELLAQDAAKSPIPGLNPGWDLVKTNWLTVGLGGLTVHHLVQRVKRLYSNEYVL